jgi:glutamate dehydrogenase/leucine dehydrogenase
MDAECVVVVDNLALGQAFGGVRLTDSVTVAEVARLARAMTVKNAVAGLPHGGGKAGIRIARRPLTGSDREPVVRSFAQAIRHLLDYVPGPDMGTDETAMAWIHDEIGRAVGLPAMIGGIPLDELGATGFGLAICAEALESAGHLKIDGARVAVQGFGAVGQHAALHLAQRGARVVAVSDSTGAVHDPGGLDVPALVASKRTAPVTRFPDATSIGRDDLLSVECDVLVPSAQAHAIHEGNVDHVRTRVVLQGANLAVTSGAESVLAQRGILNVPDVVANAGGVICASVEYRGGTHAQAFADIAERIQANTSEMVDRVHARRYVLPRHAAMAMARSRLDAAHVYQRRF